MNIKIKSKIVSILVLGLVMNPLSIVFAEDASSSASDAPASPTDEAVNQQVEIPLITESTSTDSITQDTVNTQETIEGNLLESTVNPNTEISATTSTSSELILENPTDNIDNTGDISSSTASSTDITEIATTSNEENIVNSENDQINNNTSNENVVTTPDQQTVEAVVIDNEFTREQEKQRVGLYEKINSKRDDNVLATFSNKDLRPRTKFSFNVRSAEKIAIKKITKMINKKKVIVPDTSTDQGTTQVDSNTGAITVTGACSAKYYVILLYRNINDYSDNPGSYILNKAYDCVNNSYSYSIDDLPNSLANGTYYLLVGGMGDSGSWTPITSLTPIDINKNN